MKTIHKYRLNIVDGPQEIEIPSTNKILHVGEEPSPYSHISLWAEVADESSLRKRLFAIYGTGRTMDEDSIIAHLGTVQMSNGFVWHVYEILAQKKRQSG